MIPYSPLHKKFLTLIGLISLGLVGGWLLWQGLLSMGRVYAWWITFIPGHLWPVRWEGGFFVLQGVGWSIFLIPLSIPLAGLWNLLRWWSTGGPWVPPDPSWRLQVLQWKRREEWDAWRQAVETQRPR